MCIEKDKTHEKKRNFKILSIDVTEYAICEHGFETKACLQKK